MSSTPEVPTISGLTHVIAGTAHSPCYARSNYGWRSPTHVLTISHLILSFLQLIVCVCSLILPTRRRKQLIKNLLALFKSTLQKWVEKLRFFEILTKTQTVSLYSCNTSCSCFVMIQPQTTSCSYFKTLMWFWKLQAFW